MESTARKKLMHGESQKGEDERWRRSGRETVRREKMHAREKVERRGTVSFSNLMALEGREIGSLN